MTSPGDGRADVALLLCTRDRCASLDPTLASIERAAAAAPSVRLAVTVVDNGSSDATPARLAEWAAARPFPVTLVHEPRPGLARARNAGLAALSARIVAMTDDDCVLHDDYLTALVARFAGVDGPTIVGGRILLGDADDLPMTVKLEDHPMTAVPGAFPGGFVMGANLACTGDVPAIVGGFDERFGAGAPFLAAEDTDWLFRAQALGVALEYCPYFIVDHHHGRRGARAAARLLAGYGYGDGALYAKHLRSDARIRAAVVQDLRDLRRDWDGSPRPFAGIRRFYLFRLRHKLAGMIAYAWACAVRRQGPIAGDARRARSRR